MVFIHLQINHIILVTALPATYMISWVVTPSIVNPAPTTYLYGTRLKYNIKKSKVRTDGTITYYVVRFSASEPTSHITAMEHPLWR